MMDQPIILLLVASSAEPSGDWAERRSQRIHAGLLGPTDESVNKERFAMVLKDEASNYLKGVGVVNKEATIMSLSL